MKATDLDSIFIKICLLAQLDALRSVGSIAQSIFWYSKWGLCCILFYFLSILLHFAFQVEFPFWGQKAGYTEQVLIEKLLYKLRCIAVVTLQMQTMFAFCVKVDTLFYFLLLISELVNYIKGNKFSLINEEPNNLKRLLSLQLVFLFI